LIFLCGVEILRMTEILEGPWRGLFDVATGNTKNIYE
jgi:hypothetical protein